MLRKIEKNSPLEKKGLAQKKKGAARAYRKNRPWRKKGRKKKNQGERPFFWTEKKGALESNMPTKEPWANGSPNSERFVIMKYPASDEVYWERWVNFMLWRLMRLLFHRKLNTAWGAQENQ